MDDEEMVVYLANIAFIAAADGSLDPREAKAIEAIRQEIGASRSDLEKALTSVVQGKHRVSPAGRFSDKVRNLEDMILVSVSDGKMAKTEKPTLLTFAKAIKVSQDQLSEMLSESKLRIASHSASKACSSCHVEIPPESKFCPHCGTKS